ncbi:MAG: S4 domain-containing protein, partial [Actinomycetota bacterium]|nr:S4 domain-containing protein [Actinomycetota bacterium]
MTRRRLDTELVRRGLTSSRQQAQELIESGRVTVGGAPAAKAARLVGA